MPLPQLVAAIGIQRDDAAMGLTAHMLGAARYSNLKGRDGNKQAVIVKTDGAGDNRLLKKPRLFLPDDVQGLWVDSKNSGQ
jgi:hypothetical protein